MGAFALALAESRDVPPSRGIAYERDAWTIENDRRHLESTEEERTRTDGDTHGGGGDAWAGAKTRILADHHVGEAEADRPPRRRNVADLYAAAERTLAARDELIAMRLDEYV